VLKKVCTTFWKAVAFVGSFFAMPESKDDDPLLFNPHYSAFGAIIHECARYEYLMVGITAKILGLKVIQASVMMADLPYRGKLATFKATIKLHDLKPEQREKIIWFLGNMSKHNQLRNHIAHSTWKRGDRPDSIKPLGCDVRSGEAVFLGIGENETDYTLQDLEGVAMDLINNRNAFAKYLREQNLLASA
jgi:hypothetical protein